MNMENEKKWRLLKNSDIKKIQKSRFNKSDDFVGKNIVKYVYKTNNLTYYLTIENEKTYIRCFSDYQEITFEDFLKKLSYLECEV